MLQNPPLLTFCFLILLASCQKDNNKNYSNQELFAQEHPAFSSKFEEQLSSLYTDNKLLGDFIIAIVDENGMAYSFAFNKDIMEGKASSLGNNSPIYIASHTKSFTGTLLKILEEQGKVDLDSSLAFYIPELHFEEGIHTKDIAIRDLLNHSHGVMALKMIWKTAFLGYSGENSELIKDLNSNPIFDTSRKFRYSNVGPIIAGMVAEKVTGNSWKVDMKEHIFSPLGMANTSAFVSDFDANQILPSVIVSKGQVIEAEFYKDDITMHAAGGILSTAHDLSNWLSANIRQDANLMSKPAWKEIHSSTIAQDRTFFTYARNGYSLGWDIATYQKDTILTRFGGLAGISFHASFIPSKSIGIIAFSNDNRASLLPHLAANYAYNLINQPSFSDSIFNAEKEIFKNSYDKRSQNTYPNETELIFGSSENDKILGTYENNLNWPEIKITKKDSTYVFKWGILDSQVYRSEDGNFIGNLGPMLRSFQIKNDSLFTGSLKYSKKSM